MFLFLNKSSYVVDCFVYLCVQIKDVCFKKLRKECNLLEMSVG